MTKRKFLATLLITVFIFSLLSLTFTVAASHGEEVDPDELAKCIEDYIYQKLIPGRNKLASIVKQVRKYDNKLVKELNKQVKKLDECKAKLEKTVKELKNLEDQDELNKIINEYRIIVKILNKIADKIEENETLRNISSNVAEKLREVTELIDPPATGDGGPPI